MLNLKFEDKIKLWRDIRTQLENNSNPINLILDFIAKLPNSSRKINSWDPSYIVGPWELWEASSFTDFDKALLISYTFQLTERFKEAKIEIHITTNTKTEELLHLVYIDDRVISLQTNETWLAEQTPSHIVSQKIYQMDAIQ